MSRDDYKLVKRWRLDEWKDQASKEVVGIYITSEGSFYARMPENERGELFRADTKELLERHLREAAPRIFGLAWEKVVRVRLEPAMRWSSTAHTGFGSAVTWDPNDPKTAGDVVKLSYDRMEVAKTPAGKRVEREWYHPGMREATGQDFRTIREDRYRPVPGVDAELPYSEALWASLDDFRSRIQELNHMLRHLISRDDLADRLLAATRQPLLVMTNDDK